MTTTRMRCLSRNVRGENVVYIGRPTKWGNPFIVVEDGTREEVTAKFREYLERHPRLVDEARRVLAGKTLACFCSISELCHGDVWIEVLDKQLEEQ